MTRGKKFRPTRRRPVSERSLFGQKLAGYTRTLDRTDLLGLVRGGEDTHLEFKIRLVNTEKITSEVVAMANSGGGAILFGVNDQRRLEGLDDPESVEEQIIDICRNQVKPPLLPRIDKVAFDNGTRIVVLQVDDRRAPHRTPDDRFFVRIGSTKREADGDEIAALFAASRVAAFEDMPLIGSAVEDVDEALVWSYIRDLEGESFSEPGGYPTGDALRDLRIAVDYAGRIVPTLAGLLLFGRSDAVDSLVPHARVVLTRFSGTDAGAGSVVETQPAGGNLMRMFDVSLAFIRRYADLWDSKPPRTARSAEPLEPVPPRANYSRQAVIEGMVNLLVHRDYSLAGSEARVNVFDDRIEFVNPSRTQGVTPKAVAYGAVMRRNPRLHRVLTSEEYGAEPAGRGMPSLRRFHLSFSRREPRLSVLGDEFRISLSGI